MLRTLFIAAALAAIAAAPAQAQGRVLLMPGVTYERQVQFTSHGPVAVHVMIAPRPGGAYSLRPVLSNGAIVGRDRVTAMQRGVRDATSAGVNGDLFTWADGRPSGMLMQGGVLHHPPLPDRSSLGIASDGSLRVQRLRMFGTWRGSGQRRAMDLNESPTPNGFSLFTPAWGPSTPAQAGVVEAVIAPFPPTTPNLDLQGPVVSAAQTGGGTAIPAGGAVLVARGTAAQRLVAEAPPGTTVTIRLLLNPDTSGIVDAIGGGPALVREGKPIFRANELFSTAQLARNPRTGVGQLADGRVLFVVVDGRRPGYSVGMTNFELAQTLVRLGAVTGTGLDAGGSSTMAFDGTLLNRPSDPGGERAVSEGLFLLYSGVVAAAPGEPVLSPNGDGVAESEPLSYKLARPSTATVTLIGPDRTSRVLDQGAKPAGVHRFSWDGKNADGTEAAEGTWRLSVSAVDDQGQTTTADRYFSLNRTLGQLSVVPGLVRVGRGGMLRSTFTLTRPARVTATLRTRTGIVVATIARGLSRPAGPQTLAWSGRAGRRFVPSGSYVVRIRAASEVGAAELDAPVRIRRVAPAPKRRP
ncbi:MAG TPA: phosphodiester glycosidase family protein [Gaiellaceae bacterium]|nr:phosphodiester glycosidase family protein [Gaiellaceae bacterium]